MGPIKIIDREDDQICYYTSLDDAITGYREWFGDERDDALMRHRAQFALHNDCPPPKYSAPKLGAEIKISARPQTSGLYYYICRK